MSQGTSANRTDRFSEVLLTQGVDAFFAHHPITMSYLTGFGEDAHERFMTVAFSPSGQVTVICPSLSEAQVRRAGMTDVRSWKDGEDPLELFAELAEQWDLRAGIVAVDDTMPAHMLLKMQESLPEALFKAGGSLVGSLMRNKDAHEIEMLRKAGKIADDTFEAILPKVRAGLTERQVERMLNDSMTDMGGTPTFCIIGAGANGAEPHHLTDDTVLKEGDVVIMDFGCSLHGYQSDITRTIALGDPGDEARTVYAAVYAAHMAGRKAIAPGVSGAQVDAAARQQIVDAGYGEAFFHRTGHGIGMNGHEEPYISGDNHVRLEPGNCFSIEPGVYLTGRFGVRIENIVACTEGGHESMNAEPSPVLLSVLP